MKLKCPHCLETLSLGEVKPGVYKPKCTKCQKRFVLQVTDEDPPKIRVGKGEKRKKPAAETQASESPAARTRADSGNAAPTVDAAVEATLDAPAASTGGESVSPKTPASAGAVDATIDHPIESGAAVKPTQASATTPAFEQTVDQTADAPIRTAGASIQGDSAAPKVSTGSGSAGAANASQEPADETIDGASPSKLGGYQIVRMLGRGAMGAVYQAKQLSLDRDVALKTIRGRLADNPASMARFTREAYAAAQLTHHNVVQIYDFGQDAGLHYFSMEWVRGGTLSDLVREKGCIDPRLAASYILQAARGLQFAHRSGMVHRDVKPANLLLSEEGVVKVADLGLVKVPDDIDPDSSDDEMLSGRQSGTQVTMQGSAVGTPAYMAPEQGADASTVDHRADIYSLGCSLFYLLAGQSPYDGSLVSEVIEKHARAPVPDLSEINSRIPEPLVAIVRRSMAKRADDRFDSLADMIQELEAYLGVDSMQGFSPSSDQADRWEELSAVYAKTQLPLKLGGTLFLALAGVSALATLSSPLISIWSVMFGPSLFVAACTAVLALGAARGGNAVANHLRRWMGTLSWMEWGIGIFAAIVFVLVLLVSGLWVGALVGVVLGAGLGAGYHFAIREPVAKAGAAPLEAARKFVRDLRISGAEESGLRDFLARYAGKGWQSIFEALFGYDAMVKMRTKLAADPAFDGPTSGKSIRDRVCANLAAKVEAKQQEEDQAKLAKVEQQSLIAQGLTESEAREQGWQMASAIMESAQQPVDAEAENVQALADAKRKRMKAMLADARSGRYKKKRDPLKPVKMLLSGYIRLLAGCLLLGVFAIAAQTTGLLDQVRTGDIDLETLPTDASTDALGESLSIWSVGVAGLFLCLSAFVSGWRMSPFAMVATVVILFGPTMGIPSMGPADAWMVAAAAGFVIYIPGILFGETKI